MVGNPVNSQNHESSRRIMMVITSLGFGGADTQVVSIARILRSRGREVAVVSMVPPAAHTETLAAIGVSVHSLRMRRRVPDPRAMFRLRKLIRQWKPDVVHSHMVHANLLTRLTRCIAPVPALVCTAHNTRESSERGGPTWHKELLYRLTDPLADQTTIICEAGRQHYVNSKAVPASRIKVIPIGIDCDSFAPNPQKRDLARFNLGIPDDRFTFLAVGRMVVQKDYPNLLRAASLLRQHPWTLLIAGGGPLKNEVEKLCSELNLSEHVRFLGVNQDIRSWYHAADSFVMSSSVEGMPVVLLEAAASGLPAVVTNAGGNGEVVVNGQTGFVVPKANHHALKHAMERMLSLPVAQRKQLGEAARSRALTEFEIGKVVSRWETLYDGCLLRQSSAPAVPLGSILSARHSPRENV